PIPARKRCLRRCWEQRRCTNLRRKWRARESEIRLLPSPEGRSAPWRRRAPGFQARPTAFGALHLNIDCLGAGRDGGFEHAQLLLHAAVEPSVILMPAAGGEHRTIGVPLQEFADR